jgi:hypothetical protein
LTAEAKALALVIRLSGAFIDGRDLAEWTIRMAENRETGSTPPDRAKELGIGGMLDE